MVIKLSNTLQLQSSSSNPHLVIYGFWLRLSEILLLAAFFAGKNDSNRVDNSDCCITLLQEILLTCTFIRHFFLLCFWRRHFFLKIIFTLYFISRTNLVSLFSVANGKLVAVVCNTCFISEVVLGAMWHVFYWIVFDRNIFLFI